MRPKPLMPTRIDIFVVPALAAGVIIQRQGVGVIFERRRVGGVSVCFLRVDGVMRRFAARGGFGGRGVPREILVCEPPAHGLLLQNR